MSCRSVGRVSGRPFMPFATSTAQSVAAAVVTAAKATLMRRGAVMAARSSVKTGAPLRNERRARVEGLALGKPRLFKHTQWLWTLL